MSDPKHDVRLTIATVKLDRIMSDHAYTRRHKSDGPMLSRLSRDHGNLLIYDTAGKCDLYAEHNGDQVRSDAARLLQHMSPPIVEELIRGYRLAKSAGLLGDGQHSDAVELASRLRGHFAPSEHIEDGRKAMAAMAESIHRELRKAGKL